MILVPLLPSLFVYLHDPFYFSRDMLFSVVFGLAVTFVFYVMCGYPALLGILSHFMARPVQKTDRLRTVSVIIAVHNGERFIRGKLNSVLALDYPRELMQILVVSDGSTDETDNIVREFDNEGVQLLQVTHAGKPAALNAAIPRSHGEILLLTDIRQELDRASLRRLVACYGDESVGVVSGEMTIREGTNQEEANVGLYWRYESWIRDQLGHLDSMFGATGPFYTMRRELAVHIPPDMLLDDMYLPMAAFFRGYRLIVEKTARSFDYPTGLKTEFKRKVRTLAGNYQLMVAMPQLLGLRNRMLFHFVSYKLGRLLLPYALITAAISSLFLPGLLSWLAVGGQVAFYLMAAMDGVVPQKTLFKRVSSPARTFVMMMVAVICALRVFFVSPQSLWTESTVGLSETSIAQLTIT